jgi:predicted  nucleic acid-binding Zn-ribbon protein
MRVRHKQPTLVSMWMLDVFCCALGCVTLLFLLNNRTATDDARRNENALVDLETAEKRLAAALTELDSTRLKLNSEAAGREKLSVALTELQGLELNLSDTVTRLAAELAASRAETDDVAKKLARARDDAKTAQALAAATQADLDKLQAKADATGKELAAARDRSADADELMRKRQKEAADLAKKLTDTTSAADDLARLLRKRDDEKAALVKETADLRKQLDDLDGRLAAARKAEDAAAKAAKAAAADLAALKEKGGADLTAARAEADVLGGKLAVAKATIIDLQGEKAKLADKVDKLRADTEARFAGIVTSGKRVVFVVDMSGSMAKKDVNTGDPTKWPLVVETVGRLMRSIPTLEKFQVVVFSAQARWLLAEGEWQEYAGEKSVRAVTDALLKVRPQDDTNLYAGLDTAFKLRPAGLDTVYLFSDGLPTSGPGLSAAQQAASPPLKETEKSEVLGRHLRRVLADEWNRPAGGRRPVKINAVGFYFESPDVGAFLWALARDHDGSFVGMSKP